MIDRSALLADTKVLTGRLIDDLRERTESDDESRMGVRNTYDRARSAGRTDKTWEEWREDLLAQVAAGWVLASVFVRFCEDNSLVDTPLLSGPGRALDIARDHRAEFFRADPSAGDREWLVEVYQHYQRIPAAAQIFGDRNPLWQLAPSADGARELLETWWTRDDEGREIRHDFTDPDLDTRFLGDLYQDLSEHARKQYALFQTPDFIEAFLLERTLDPAIAEFGLADVKMIDPTCGSGHFLLGAFERLLARWREREPGTGARELVQRALDAVHGVDVNPFAVEIARFRLLVAALRAAGERRLGDLPAFRLNLAVGDSLLHGTRPGTFFSGAVEFGDALRHHYPTEDAEAAEHILTADTYHAVVGNPPYITVKDAALNGVYRALYDSCYRQYSLAVPFKERFFQLAAHGNAERQAGFVGMITANSFMKREFGSKVIEEFLTSVDLTHVIDTSEASIFPQFNNLKTVILFGRDRAPVGDTVRAVLGIRGATGRPDDPASGKVWSSIRDLVDKPGTENEFVSVDDVARQRFDKHPWSLQGGAAPALKAKIEGAGSARLDDAVTEVGFGVVTREDDAFRIGAPAALRQHVQPEHVRALVAGDEVRDWGIPHAEGAIWPYSPERLSAECDDGLFRLLWRCRTQLSERVAYGKTQLERDLHWWEYSMFFDKRFKTPLSIVFAEVATHNHFVLDRGGKVFKQTAPLIKLPKEAGEEEHLELLGLLNSSVAGFWIRSVTHAHKGGAEPWEHHHALDSTKLKLFPMPSGRPLQLARALDAAAQELALVLPVAVAEREPPTRAALDTAAERATVLRARMVALQEELDWRCYRLYGLVDQDLTLDVDRVPALEKGQRAFEIALARRVVAGEAPSSWFERHGSTPITELPVHWPQDYRDLVHLRLDLIESDRGIRLLERPEYKRRWNWDDLSGLERDAQRSWLLDRIEARASAGAEEPAVTTCARLADALSRDADASEVAHDLGGAGVDLVALVTDLVNSTSVPFLAAWRLTDSGLRKRAAWVRTWALQHIEDDLAARTELPEDDPQHLSEAEHAVARKEAGVEKIPVPPKYAKADFRNGISWTLRGKLDVPKERFVAYPGTKAGADTSPVVGWAGWDHLHQARALAGHYSARKAAGAEVDELVPLLAGVDELVPWLLQWHDDPDPTFGERMGQFFDGFVATEAAGLGVTRDELAAWRPPAATRGRRRKART